MATITFQVTDKDLAGLLRSLFDPSAEAKVQVMVHFRRRPKRADQTMNLIWEVEMLPDNGGIYRTLLEGDRGQKDIHNNQS
jgi:hypothetical protein